MSLWKQFATDPAKEREGILIQFAPNDDKTVPAFRIRQRNDRNQEYAIMLKRETEPYRRSIELGTLDGMQSRAIYMKVFCSTVLIGWDNVQDKQGVTVAYSPDKAFELMLDLPELYDELIKQADRLSNFRQQEVEQERKN